MGYSLDSDVVIDHLAGDPAARQLIDRLGPDGVAISAITYMEVYLGTLVAPDSGRARAKLDAFLSAVPSPQFPPTPLDDVPSCGRSSCNAAGGCGRALLTS